jgi:DHA2 family multidrug resistance protein
MMQAASISQPDARYKWVVVVVTVFGTFLSALDQTIVNIAIPRFQLAFSADLGSVQWILTGYLLAQGVATPVAAYFSDRLGIKRYYVVSLGLFTLASLLCGLAPTLPLLIAFRFVQGLGSAALVPLSLAMIFRAFPAREHGLALGVFGVPTLIAPAIGPTLGGYLVTAVGWQAIFLLNLPIGLAGVVLALVLLREERVEARSRFDLVGFCLVTLGLAAVLYACSASSTLGWNALPVLGALGSGVLLLVLFVLFDLRQARAGQPHLLKLRLFATASFSTATFASVLVFFCLFGGLLLIPIYLQLLRGLSAFDAGLFLLPQALASMVTIVVGGRLVDRLGARAVVLPGMLLLGLATWFLTSITLDWPLWWFQVVLVLRGLAFGLVVQPLTVAAMAEVQPVQMAQATTLNTVARSVASSLGVAVLAAVFQARSTLHYHQLATTNGLQALLRLQAAVLGLQDTAWFTLAFIGIAIVATLFVREKKRPAADIARPAVSRAGRTSYHQATM